MMVNYSTVLEQTAAPSLAAAVAGGQEIVKPHLERQCADASSGNAFSGVHRVVSFRLIFFVLRARVADVYRISLFLARNVT